MTLSLNSVRTEKVSNPPRIMVVGPSAIGKSEFCSNTPGSFLLDIEGGADRFETPVLKATDAKFGEIVRFLKTDILEGKHSYRTLCIDSLDWLEQSIVEHICAKNGVDTIGKIPHGAGYGEITDLSYAFTRLLDKIRLERKMMIVLTCHAVVKPVNLPGIELHDSFAPDLGKQILAVFKEWVDFMLFANFEMHIDTEKVGLKTVAKQVGQTKRVLYTQKTLAFDAKSREPLPAELPFTWKAFATALKKARAVPAVEPQTTEGLTNDAHGE